MDSDEEYYYSSDDNDEESYDESDNTVKVMKNYTILNEEEIKKLQDNDISTVCNVLSVSKGIACYLLCRNGWNVDSANEDWFNNQENIVMTSRKRKSGAQICSICYDLVPVENLLSVSCGHPFCIDCYKSYIATSINDGAGCLTLCCPEPRCKTPVGLDIVEQLASEGQKKRYNKYLISSYIEGNKKRRWCPAPGCEFAVQFDHDGEGGSCDVTCECQYVFCWKCMEEKHRPIDCQTVAKWIAKSTSEGENATWIMAYTKPCPKCHKSIEKNQGCNHMTCRAPCRHQFCWTCLGSWESHNDSYRCNQFTGGGGTSKEGTSEKTRENARLHLERYVHYYDRWLSNDKSIKLALTDLGRARSEHIELLGRVHGENGAQLTFVEECWDQIVECRRVLKWTYAYGYYMDVEKEEAKVKLFEYLQGGAESALERLHHCAEKEMEKYLKAECAMDDFNDFRTKLVGLTKVTKDYFENLVRALENNLSEVQSFDKRTRQEVMLDGQNTTEGNQNTAQQQNVVLGDRNTTDEVDYQEAILNSINIY